MMGEYTQSLAARIIAARANLNECLATQGALHPSTRAAEAKLTELNDDAYYLFSPRHA